MQDYADLVPSEGLVAPSGEHEKTPQRRVFKFKLVLTEEKDNRKEFEIEPTRLISTSVKLKVWERDQGMCVICGNKENFHFDHIIPYSKGGSSFTADNIQLLCERHNLEKRDKIQ
jgi:5-methylcytosine-specific restriction endonuclease McrA